MKDQIVVCRKWNDPTITTRVVVSKSDIKINMTLEDFEKGLINSVNMKVIEDQIRNSLGSVMWVFTEKAFAKKLSEAFNDLMVKGIVADVMKNAITDVVTEMKATTAQVMES